MPPVNIVKRNTPRRPTSSSVLKFQKNQPWPPSNACNLAYARLYEESRVRAKAEAKAKSGCKSDTRRA